MSWYANGGRISTGPQPDGSMVVKVTGGMYARRIDVYQVLLICGECADDALVRHKNGRPILDHEILEAIGEWRDVHECGGLL